MDNDEQNPINHLLSDPLNDALGIEGDAPYEPREVQLPAPISQDADYEFARKSTYTAIQRAEEALDQMMIVARVSAHPRAYEVTAGLVKTIIEGNRHLLGLRKDVSGGDVSPKTVNNTLVVTPSELLEMMKKKTLG